MAYTRWNESGHYIFGGEDYVDFNGTPIDDAAVDVFLHKLYGLRGRPDDEFWERYDHGGRVIDNFLRGFRIERVSRYSDTKKRAGEIAALADAIWRDHYTPLVGEAQVAYMLEKFQSAERITEDIDKNGHTYFTAERSKNDTLIGYCCAVPNDGYLLLSKLYVRKEHRGFGVARGFLNEAIALCKYEYQLSEIRLTVNKGNDYAIKVYEHMGFATVDSVKTDIDGGFFMDDYVMALAVKGQGRNDG